VRLLTIGATVPKLALHPQGARVREAAGAIARSRVRWVEYQAADDPISFYKVDPVSLRRRVEYAPTDNPYVRRVQVPELVSPERWRRMRRRWLRIHHQFLFGNDQRARYDLGMFLVGDAPFDAVAGAPRGALDVYGEANPPC
jgi:hypothetical protein